MIDDKILAAAEEGDIDALAQLDQMGLIAGANDDLETFAKRLHTLRKNISEFNQELEDKSKFTVDGMSFDKDTLIPRKVFKEARKHTEELYEFSIDWVPGFFKNAGILFGGCCFSSEPDFFSFFLVRKAFRDQSRWLWYDRDELLAHELCHVARSGMGSTVYEEFFAYQTSPKKFRKVAGSTLYSAVDTYLIMGTVFMPLLVQIYNVFNYTTPEAAIPIWPFWVILAGLIGRLCLRYKKIKHTAACALKNLKLVFGKKHHLAIIFRSTDEEIVDLSKLDDKEKLSQWLKNKEENLIRWKVILKRFPSQ